ncbi:MAG: hypothetical protein JW744_03380 [Candidatus Diapherotrites archaeon]|uniref:Uncharacterized protein n=1 Tax=Candidatus Iainarchaeum sp. TaxID=3101447 RepID=A0A938YUP7_9ARCH|nr:hypothetical protein [Candidatus Diapherotrites archaeon]
MVFMPRPKPKPVREKTGEERQLALARGKVRNINVLLKQHIPAGWKLMLEMRKIKEKQRIKAIIQRRKKKKPKKKK